MIVMGHAAASQPSGNPQVIGEDAFEAPETAVWDEQRDVYLVSSINGELTAQDDNGFISRVAPSGEIIDLRWIDGGRPETTLHAPKGMVLTAEHLIVADVRTVRFYDRTTGKPAHQWQVPGAYMLNDPAVAPDGTIYCTDTGGSTTEHPGAVYRFAADGESQRIAHGTDYDRPDGLLAEAEGLLVAPFESHARTLYRLNSDGRRQHFATLPTAKLDGLLRLPDGRLIVTSWSGKTVYLLDPSGNSASVLANGIRSPAQIGYDRERRRLLVPVLREDKLLVYDVPPGPDSGSDMNDNSQDERG